MTYIVLKDKPSLGYYAIMKIDGMDKFLIWQQQYPQISESGLNKLVDILTEINPTDWVARATCRTILGQSTEIGSSWTFTANTSTNNNTFTHSVNTEPPS